MAADTVGVPATGGDETDYGAPSSGGLPNPDVFEQKCWLNTVHGSRDSVTVSDSCRRKTNRKEATVPIDVLIADDRVYLQDAFAQIQEYHALLGEWTTKFNQEQATFNQLGQQIANSKAPKGMTPERTAIVDRLQAEHQQKLAEERKRREQEIVEERKRREQEELEKRLAEERREQEAKEMERKAAQKSAQDNLDSFAKVLRTVDPEGNLFGDITSSDKTVTVQVTNYWHITNYQVRYQAAQNLWEAWASITSPSEPDSARLKIVDLNGNEVGGSRILAGSLIWVQKQ